MLWCGRHVCLQAIHNDKIRGRKKGERVVCIFLVLKKEYLSPKKWKLTKRHPYAKRKGEKGLIGDTFEFAETRSWLGEQRHSLKRYLSCHVFFASMIIIVIILSCMKVNTHLEERLRDNHLGNCYIWEQILLNNPPIIIIVIFIRWESFKLQRELFLSSNGSSF